jgi:hypothetical protein
MIIFGCITKYSPKDIRPYVESIEKSGFKGKKMMLVYDVPQETIDYLKSFGWDLFGSELQQHIIIQRFRDAYVVLDQFKDETIIWTDVKDVIFQKDPTFWIEKNMKKEILSLSESITFKDDDWATRNAGTSFPMEWEWLKEKTSYCAGTIIGKGNAIRDLFLEIYHWSLQTSNPGQLGDQAAYNILINLNHFKENVQFVNQEEGLATQLGTVLIKKEQFGDKLLEPTPIITEDFVITNQHGEVFPIVHQYDRHPQLKQKLEEKYQVKVLPEPQKNDNPPGFTYEKWKEIQKFGGYDESYNEMLKGKRVVVVGPSPSLEGSGKGDWIDDFDVVVRINKAFPVEEEMTQDIGTRTDIHYHCLCTDMHCGGPVFYKEMKDSNVFVSCPYPKWIRNFHGDVTRFERDNKKWDLGFHVLDTDYYLGIADMLGTRANSGTLTILDLLCYDVKELHITGFTWFRDGWRKSYKDHTKIFGEVEGKKKEEKWLKGEFDGNHVQKPQEDLVREIYLNDDRVFIDDIMKDILEVE